MAITFNRFRLEQLLEVHRTDNQTICRLLGVAKTQSYKYIHGGMPLDALQLAAICNYFRKELTYFFAEDESQTNIVSEPSAQYHSESELRNIEKETEKLKHENDRLANQLSMIQTAVEQLNGLVFQKKSKLPAALLAASDPN